MIDFLTNPDADFVPGKYLFWLVIGGLLVGLATFAFPPLGLGATLAGILYGAGALSGIGVGMFLTAMREVLYLDGGLASTFKAALGLMLASPLFILFGALNALGIAVTGASIGITAAIAFGVGAVAPWTMRVFFGSSALDHQDLGKPSNPATITTLNNPTANAIDHNDLYNDLMQGTTEDLKSYIESGLDVNTNVTLGLGNSPLIVLAVNASEGKEKVDYLIQKNANVNATNNQGYTALHMAADAGKVEIVKALVAARADQNLTNNQGKTPWDLANENWPHTIKQMQLTQPAAEEVDAGAALVL